MSTKRELLTIAALVMGVGLLAVGAIAWGFSPSTPAKVSIGPGPVKALSQSVANVEVTNSGFIPAAVQVAPGTVVTWTNDTSSSVQIASNPYPTHSSLTGLFSGSIPPQGTYSYVFAKAGQWSYQDYLNPSVNGSVDVK